MGAISSGNTGKLYYDFYETTNKENVSHFIDGLRQSIGHNERICLVLDNHSAHHSYLIRDEL